MNKRKLIKNTLILLLTIFTFFFVVPITAAMELPTNTIFYFQEDGKNISEYKIKQEDFDTIKEFQGKIILNNYETAKASLTFGNDTNWEDIQFELLNIKSDIENEQLLEDLQVCISVDGSVVFAGPFNKLSEPLTNYIPPEDIVIDFEFFIHEGSEKEYSDVEMNLILSTHIRSNITVCPEPDPVFPELQQYTINEDTVNKEFTLNSSAIFPNSDMDLGFEIINELNQDIDLTIKNISFINSETNTIESISPADINFYFNPEYFDTWVQIPVNSNLVEYIGLNYPDYEGKISFSVTFETKTLPTEPENNDSSLNTEESTSEIPSETESSSVEKTTIEETSESELESNDTSSNTEHNSEIPEKVETGDKGSINYTYVFLLIAAFIASLYVYKIIE